MSSKVPSTPPKDAELLLVLGPFSGAAPPPRCLFCRGMVTAASLAPISHKGQTGLSASESKLGPGFRAKLLNSTIFPTARLETERDEHCVSSSPEAFLSPAPDAAARAS